MIIALTAIGSLIAWWIFGFAVINAIDKTKRVSKWVMSDPTSVVSYVVMTFWPVLACYTYYCERGKR